MVTVGQDPMALLARRALQLQLQLPERVALPQGGACDLISCKQKLHIGQLPRGSTWRSDVRCLVVSGCS